MSPSSASASSKHPKNKFQAVIFDIDNVLIDTRNSYTLAIRWTIDLYLTHGKIPFFRSRKPSKDPQILSAADVDAFKLLGGFNDDWDCCYGLLVYLLNLPVKGRSVEDLKKEMKIQEFVKNVRERPLRVNGIVKLLGRPSGVMIERISRIFQEVYLGSNLFRQIERMNPVYWKKKGLIHREKLLFRQSTFAALKEKGLKLGIATGRPRFEAVYSLNHLGIMDHFDSMTTMTEVRKAEKEMKQSLRKPHPFSVLQTAKRLGVTEGALYVGDLPDDMLAAFEAKKEIGIESVAFPYCTADRKTADRELMQCKPDFLIEKPGDLIRLIQRPGSYRVNGG